MLFLLVFSLLFDHLAEGAVARFQENNSGVLGTVTINDRQIIVDINITQAIPKLPTGCFDDGARYHIHAFWNYNDSNDRSGANPCGYDYTGNHWDPWVACSNSTGNEYCLKFPKNFTHKCVSGSSAYLTTTGNYTCNQTVYEANPFACEVGDFSGKYGRLTFSNNISQRTDSSFWEVKSSDVYFKSIVFHCGATNQRAFCAPFNTEGDTTNVSLTQSGESLKASFEGNLQDSYIELNDDGSYNINVDFGKVHLSSTCDTISYKIYNSWNGSESSYVGDSNCTNVVGNVYDPTVSCLSGSDSKFCYNTYRCDDASYIYNCSTKYNRYYCSPSDLSGKYGILKIMNNNSKFALSGKDELMIPMSLIANKSIVLECVNTSVKIACAKFIQTSSSSSSNKLSTTDIILIIVFSIIGLILIAVIAYCFWKRKASPTGREEERTPLTAKQQL